MTMQFEQVFTSAIEVGIATAGFSGIAAVLGQRNPGTWTGGELGRISILLQTSFGAIALSFLPLILDGAGLAEPTIWRIGSGSYVLYMLVALPIRYRGITRIYEADRSVSLGLFRIVSPMVVGFAGFQIYNAAVLHSGWVFVLTVMFELTMALLMFVRLLGSLWSQKTG